MNKTKFPIRIPFSALALVLLALAVGAQKALPPPRPAIYKAPVASDFVRYVSPEKIFEIVFPGKPDHKEADGDSARTSVTLTGDRAAYSIVSIYDYKPAFQIEKNQYLENYRSRILSREKTKIDSEMDVETNGVKGTEFKINNYYEYEVRRVFIVGNRVFELKNAVANWHIIGEKTKAEFLTEADRFMNSFKILNGTN